MEKFARLCSITGKGMNEGFVFGACEDIYIADDDDALKKCQEQGYATLEESYEDGNHYWTVWSEDDIDEDDNWYDEDGKEYTNCHKCKQETVVLEEFTFCTHCLTHL